MNLYYCAMSPPCRSVLMGVKALGVKLNKNLVDLQKRENLTPEYKKINPLNTVPALVDNGFLVTDSRAILIYLSQKYGKNDSWYPNDPQKQAVVNQRLLFDCSLLYRSFSDYYYPIVFGNQPAIPLLFNKIEKSMGFFDTLLVGQQYAAGEHPTIADIGLLATISSFDIASFDLKKYENVHRWYEHCKKTIPGWDENWEGCQRFKNLFFK